MSDKKYNGWTNYATWRINLEIFDGQTAEDLGISRMDRRDAGECLKEQVEEIICSTTAEGVARDYALAFVSDVNYEEIASHLLEDSE